MTKAHPNEGYGLRRGVLSCVNSPLKCLTLCVLDGNYMSPREARDEMSQWVESLPDPSTFRSYCRKTFSPAGVVEKGGRKEKYRLTPKGREVVLPVALHVLDRYEHFPTHSILGSSGGSSKSNAPSNRVNVLESIVQEGATQEIQVAKETNLPVSVVKGALDALNDVGLIYFDSVSGEDKGFSLFSWNPKGPTEVRPIHRYAKLTEQVAHHLKEERRPLSYHDFSHLKGSKHNLSSILWGLQKIGYATHTGFKGSEVQSSITLLEKGEDFYSQWWLPIKDHLDGEELPIKPIPPQINDYVTLYLKDSPNTRSHTRDLRKEVLDHIREHPKTRPVELAKMLGETGQKIRRVLRDLSEKGKVRSFHEGKGVFYNAR